MGKSISEIKKELEQIPLEELSACMAQYESDERKGVQAILASCQKKLEKEGKVFVIAPESTYGVGRTETDTIKLRRLYDEGYRIATEQTDALRAYLNK